MDKINPITERFIKDIKSGNKRKVVFLGEEFIINPNVFPLDSEFSYSSHVTANNIRGELGVVLDIGTGCGVHAIIAAKNGAKKVLAVDIDDNSLQNAQENVQLHDLHEIIEVRKSDLFDAIRGDEIFDTIISNIPFSDMYYESDISHFLFDPEFVLHERLLKFASSYLADGGLLYIPTGVVANEEKLIMLIDCYDYMIQDIFSEEKGGVEWKVYVIRRI